LLSIEKISLNEIITMDIPKQPDQITQRLNHLNFEVNSGLNEIREQLRELKDLEKQVIKNDDQFIEFLNSALKTSENSK